MKSMVFLGLACMALVTPLRAQTVDLSAIHTTPLVFDAETGDAPRINTRHATIHTATRVVARPDANRTLQAVCEVDPQVRQGMLPRHNPRTPAE